MSAIGGDVEWGDGDGSDDDSVIEVWDGDGALRETTTTGANKKKTGVSADGEDVVPYLVKDSGSGTSSGIGGDYMDIDDDDDVQEVGADGSVLTITDERKLPAVVAGLRIGGTGTAVASAAGAAMATAGSAGHVYDLCDDDDDDEYDNGDGYFDDGYYDDDFEYWEDDDDDEGYAGQPPGSDPSAGWNATVKDLPSSSSKVSAPAVKTGAEESLPPPSQSAVGGRDAAARQTTDRRKDPTPGVPSKASDDGVIDLEKDDVVDDENSNDEAAMARRYRKTLGPMRFDFCDTLKHHNVTSGFRAMLLPFGGSKTTSTTTTTTTGATAATAAAASRSKTNLIKLAKELVELKLNLPIEPTSSIFVRAQESDMSLIRALITGPEGTPYENGCFFFDFHLHDYPHVPPKARFLTTASGRVRFNPNLYHCGKVCLSLLGTWSGPGWEPKKSTFLQVLVSIQGLILVPDPYYNEPGFEPGKHKTESERYNVNIRRYTVDHAIHDALQTILQDSEAKPDPYPEFQQIVFEHFRLRSASIRRQLDDWQGRDRSIAPSIVRARTLLELVARHETLPAAQAEYATMPASATSRAGPPSRRAPFPMPSIPMSFPNLFGQPMTMNSSSVTTPAATSTTPATVLSAIESSQLHQQQYFPPFQPGMATAPSTAWGANGVGSTGSAATTAGLTPVQGSYHTSQSPSLGLGRFMVSGRSRLTKPGGANVSGTSHNASHGTASGRAPAMAASSAAPRGTERTGVSVAAPARGAARFAARKAAPVQSAVTARNDSCSGNVNSVDGIPPSSSSNVAVSSSTTGSLARATAALGSCTKRARRGSNPGGAPKPPPGAAGNATADPHEVIVID